MADASQAGTAEATQGGERTLPDAAKLALLGIVAAVQAVPGYTILASDKWQPPDAEMFRITAAVAGAALFALVFMARRRLLRLRTRTVVAGCAGAFALAAVLLFAYDAVLRDRVVHYIFDEKPYLTVRPFGSRYWAKGEILSLIQQFNDGQPPSGAGVTRIHVQNALTQAGPGAVLDPVPGGWRLLTMGTLWVLYASALGLVAIGFGIAAVRLGTGIALNRREKRANAPATAGEAKTDTAASPERAGTSEPAAASAPATPAQAEIVPPGFTTAPLNGHAASNGRGLGEPVMLRVELRAPGWAVAGAAAALAWAALRLASRRDEPRPPQPRRDREPGRRS